MRLGDNLSVVCCNGLRRTGKIVYIHPDGIFAVLEFEGRSGRWREAIMLRRKDREPNEPKSSSGRKYAPRKLYTPEEDRRILQAKNLRELSEVLGRPEGSLWSRRDKLRRRMK